MTHVKNECNMSQDYPMPQTVNGLTVDFTTYRPNVKILWEPLDPSQTDFNWTSYAVIYDYADPHMPRTKSHCKVIPQNQTQYLLPEDHWIYPSFLHIQVVSHPFSDEGSIAFKTFLPKVKTVNTPTTVPTSPEDTTKLATFIVGGLIAGLVLLLALYLAIKWWNSGQSAPRNSEDPDEMYYACYYPEGEDFRRQVAAIVNCFRLSGYNVIMDDMVSNEISSQGPTRWAETQIRKAKKVLVFLSPGLVHLNQDGGGIDSCLPQDINRVWIELEVLRDIYTTNRSASKMVCVTLPNASVQSLSLPLWARTRYKWPPDAEKIFNRLSGRRDSSVAKGLLTLCTLKKEQC